MPLMAQLCRTACSPLGHKPDPSPNAVLALALGAQDITNTSVDFTRPMTDGLRYAGPNPITESLRSLLCP